MSKKYQAFNSEMLHNTDLKIKIKISAVVFIPFFSYTVLQALLGIKNGIKVMVIERASFTSEGSEELPGLCHAGGSPGSFPLCPRGGRVLELLGAHCQPGCMVGSYPAGAGSGRGFLPS